MCVTTTWSVRLINGTVSLSDLWAVFIYENAVEMALHIGDEVYT